MVINLKAGCSMTFSCSTQRQTIVVVHRTATIYCSFPEGRHTRGREWGVFFSRLCERMLSLCHREVSAWYISLVCGQPRHFIPGPQTMTEAVGAESHSEETRECLFAGFTLPLLAEGDWSLLGSMNHCLQNSIGKIFKCTTLKIGP